MSIGGQQLILASGSPRRRELVERIVGPVVVQPADIDETPQPDECAPALVERLAVAKASVVHRSTTMHQPDRRAGVRVVGADTVVVLDDAILGKPVDRADAAATLTLLSGRSHLVMTGLAVVGVDTEGSVRAWSSVETTEVSFRDLTADEIDRYVASGEADDKAGSYGIQGSAALFVVGIVGSYDNVVGLPLHRLDQLLRLSGPGLSKGDR